jgi:hypothetical protein
LPDRPPPTSSGISAARSRAVAVANVMSPRPLRLPPCDGV